MKKALLVILMLASCSFAGNALNWVVDTAMFKQDTFVNTRWGVIFPHNAYETPYKVTGLGSDTVAAGYANDSLEVVVKFRPVTRVKNSSGNMDTLYGTAILVDTIIVSAADTASITGYMAVEDTQRVQWPSDFMQVGVTTQGKYKKSKCAGNVIIWIGRYLGEVVKSW